MIEKANFTYFRLGKLVFLKNKTNWKPRKKQVESLRVFKPTKQKLKIKDAIPEIQLSEEAKNEKEKTKKTLKNYSNEKI